MSEKENAIQYKINMLTYTGVNVTLNLVEDVELEPLITRKIVRDDEIGMPADRAQARRVLDRPQRIGLCYGANRVEGFRDDPVDKRAGPDATKP